MTQEEKELLLKDLCARLPYNPMIHIHDILVDDYDNYLCEDYLAKIRVNQITAKPYLRPMPSMTEEERNDLEKCTHYSFSYNPGDVEIRNMQYQAHDGYSFNPFFKGTFNVPISNCICTRLIDWLNKHHFDYRGLIGKGLAREAPKDMYHF
jgi:hypothetical protein